MATTNATELLNDIKTITNQIVTGYDHTQELLNHLHKIESLINGSEKQLTIYKKAKRINKNSELGKFEGFCNDMIQHTLKAKKLATHNHVNDYLYILGNKIRNMINQVCCYYYS